MKDFYKVRWEKFFYALTTAHQKGEKYQHETFEKEIKQWEWSWVTSHKDFMATPKGNPNQIAQKLFDKYYVKIQQAYE